MSIWQRAYETYEYYAQLAAVVREGDRQPLVPLGHMIANAHIEIAINASGDLVSIRQVSPDDSKTIIPATEDSASRAGKIIVAHPLSDQLIYLTEYGGEKHEKYLQALRDWADSTYSHPKVTAVFAYIQKNTLIDDLIRYKILPEKKSGNFIQAAVKKHEKDLIRWIVHGCGNTAACWMDPDLIDAFTKYRAQLQAQSGKVFCMISAEIGSNYGKHPRGTVATPNGAKLISSNDTTGFTYRGRFAGSAQAATISYESSQKAHNALQWIVANQGSIQGGRTFVCWNPKGKPVYQAYDPLMTEENSPIAPSDYADALRQTLSGYRNALPDEEDVVLAAFDAASTGRLSVTYYNELKGSDYYDRIEAWYRSCCFNHFRFGCQSPSLYWIVCAAFGTERSGKMEIDDRIRREHMQRLLNCMVESAPIPYDLVLALRNRASQPLAFSAKDDRDKRWRKNREQVLFTACSVIRKYNNDRIGREEWTMTLDRQNNDRSYLFGRLLAAMEAAERCTYDREEDREPNAIRLQASYCERPFHTANIIHQALTPYFQRMNPGLRKYYRDMIGSIFAQLREADAAMLNMRLDDSYLLGYYLQRNDIYTAKKEKEEA